MSTTTTDIQLKRSQSQFNDVKNESIKYGEGAFLKSDEQLTYNDILALGNKHKDDALDTLENSTFFEGHKNINLIGNGVFFNSSREIVDKEGTYVKSHQISPDFKTPSQDTAKYWLITCDEEGNAICHVENMNKSNGIYITSNGVLHGGAWNDYAENRRCTSGDVGEVVCEQGNGTLILSTEKLQPLPYVISDTYGMLIGNKGDEYKPVAVTGRVLVKVNCPVKVGDVLCADKDGCATVMTRGEVANYPDRILGIVSEIPTYDTWNDVEINNRVWITIK